MHFSFMYDKSEVSGVVICPDANEDANELNNYSKLLKIKNPALLFTEQTKAGLFDDLSDEDFEILLSRFKFFNKFFNSKSELNVFQALVRMSEYILSIEPPRQQEECGND